MLEKQKIADIADQFGISFQQITDFIDSSRGDHDVRWNYVLDKKYVLKIHSAHAMWEDRLQEISRLILRYRAIGVYAPQMIPTLSGALSYSLAFRDVRLICFVEEYASYPVYDDWQKQDRKEVVEHLGLLAARYSGVDLSPIRSMWSIIDLAPLDVDVDEKQENADILAATLRKCGYTKISELLKEYNLRLRGEILRDFRALPRCVYQGDLNITNELHKDGHFVGLIDFNMAGTDVNINVFANETGWFPETMDFDALTIPEILDKMDAVQSDELAVIFRHYTMTDLEKRQFPCFNRIQELFQYPNVCQMAQWLNDMSRRQKCADLILALIQKPLEYKE